MITFFGHDDIEPFGFQVLRGDDDRTTDIGTQDARQLLIHLTSSLESSD
jgi:hypothetical protein